MANPSPVSQILTDMAIPHREFVHDGPVRSLEQAAAERGQQPGQVVRSLLFRVSEGDYVMVLVAGPQQVDWKALRQALNQNRVTMAARDEVLAVTGYELGAVAPFGLKRPIPVWVDRSVWSFAEVSLGSGRRGTAVILSRDNLRKALAALDNVTEVSLAREQAV
jgi:Cys-tRNA(Pro) deacylase